MQEMHVVKSHENAVKFCNRILEKLRPLVRHTPGL